MPAPATPTSAPRPAEPDPRPPTVAVVGAGAVGGVLGGRLAAGGAAVTFLARGATLAALRAEGLRLDAPGGALHLPAASLPAAGAVAAVEATAEGAAAVGPVDLVLVAVKAEQVRGVAPALAPLVGPDTVVVPLQNGVEASGELAAALGAAHVAEGYCRMLAEQAGPGYVRALGVVPSVGVGPRGAGAESLGERPRRTLARAAGAFRAAGVPVETPDDPRAALWEKFLFVEPLGVVGAAARAPFGALLGTPETRALLARCGEEIVAVGRAAGVVFLDDALAAAWRRYEALPADGTASMQRDLVAGRPSELDAQTGAVVRLGRAHGAATPAHDALYAVLRPQELRARAGAAPDH